MASATTKHDYSLLADLAARVREQLDHGHCSWEDIVTTLIVPDEATTVILRSMAWSRVWERGDAIVLECVEAARSHIWENLRRIQPETITTTLEGYLWTVMKTSLWKAMRPIIQRRYPIASDVRADDLPSCDTIREEFELEEARAYVASKVLSLTSDIKERRVLTLLLLEGWQRKKVACEVDVSPQRISQICGKYRPMIERAVNDVLEVL